MNEVKFLEKLKTLKKQDLQKVKGLGEVLIQNLLEFFDSDRFNYLIQNTVNLEILQSPKIVGKLSGKNICITGSFDISRDSIKEKLELLGAKIVGTVGKNTTLLLAGEDAGSKVSK
jgi:DNA ligase (NAD+)